MNARKVLAVLTPFALLIVLSGSGVEAANLGDPTDDIPDLWLRLDPSDHTLSTPSEFEWIDPAGLELISFYIDSVAGILTGPAAPDTNIGDAGGPTSWVEGWAFLQNSPTLFGEANSDANPPDRTAIRLPDIIGRDPALQPHISEPMPAIGSEWQWTDPAGAGFVNPLADLNWNYNILNVGGTYPGDVICVLIPEPGTVVMLLSGALGLVLLWRRRR